MGRMGRISGNLDRDDARMAMDGAMTPDEVAEVRRLWADYYEATARAVEIMRAEGTTEAVLPRIAAESAKAGAAMRRLKAIHGIKT